MTHVTNTKCKETKSVADCIVEAVKSDGRGPDSSLNDIGDTAPTLRKDGTPDNQSKNLGVLSLSNEVFELRKNLGLSQAKFAERFGFPVGTVRNWEQTNTKPDSAARIIIGMIKIDPDGVARLVAQAKELENT